MYFKALLCREVPNLNGGVGDVPKQSVHSLYHSRLNTLAAEAASEMVLLRKAGEKCAALFDHMHVEGEYTRPV